MILYALACVNDHRFDSWFRSGADFDEQADRGFVLCPVCSSTRVGKAIMAPAVVNHAVVVPARLAAEPETPLRPDERQMALLSAIRAIRDKVLEGENVGTRFPDEARKMHDGDIPHRSIHGQATVAEARALIEDGVGILPLPTLPDELN